MIDRNELAKVSRKDLELAWKKLSTYCERMAEKHVLDEKVACAAFDPWTAVEHDWHAKWWREASAMFQEMLKMESWNVNEWAQRTAGMEESTRRLEDAAGVKRDV